MNSLIKRIFNNKVALFFIIILLIFLPLTITTPAESDNKALAVALGFDKQDNQIEVSAQFVVPQSSQGFKMSLKSISAKAETSAQAIEKINILLGKKIGLAHCDVIVLGKGYEFDDIGKGLDYLLRGKKISKDSLIICTEATAKELIEQSVNLNENMDLTLKKILNFNENLLFAKQNTVDSFLNNYFANTSLSYATVINVEKGESEGVSVQGGGSQSSGGSSQEESEGSSSGDSKQSSGEKDKKTIVNDGTTALFKKGVFTKLLKPEQVRAFTWLKETSSAMIKIDNVTTDQLTDAEMVVEILDKSTSCNLSFKNNKPVVYAKLNILVQLDSVKNQDQKTIKDINRNIINKDVENKIKEYIYKDLNNAITFAKENKTDFFYFYEKFYKYKNKELKEYVKKLSSVDEFIENLQLFTEINISKTV